MAFNGVIRAPQPDEPSYGLFSVAEVRTHGARDEDWIGGFNVETDVCGYVTRLLPQCIATDDTPIEVHDGDDGSAWFHVSSFSIVHSFECDNSIGYNAVDRRKTVVNGLNRVTEFSVERELWTGEVAQVDSYSTPADRFLEGATDVTPSGGAAKPEVAIALVEQAFAEGNPGVQATIHITPLIAASLRKSFFFEEDGKLRTANGSLVSISRGGDGDSGPSSGGSDTTHWVYATGPVYVELGGEELITTSTSESVNPVTNAVIFVAERPAAVYFDGCSWFGALADATL